jgi:energy-coupling factor transporter ATP-binding protein EcfA2
MITRLYLRNFTAFSELRIDFSSNINVLIGENGTGKTHLLKAAYALSSGGGPFGSRTEAEDTQTNLTRKFLRVFMPLDDRLGKLHRNGATENAQLEADFAMDQRVVASFHNNSRALVIRENVNYEQYSAAPVFIPTKEVLSFMKGFVSLYEKYELSFDQTFYDVCLQLDLPEMRPEALQEKSNWAIDEIETICGGRFIFSGGGKVTFKTASAEYSANAMAEGFRKAGMLARLLATGAIKPGVSGPLFWDEPEANLNPQLMRRLVEILLELSRNGQQIILATHDYVLLKWFDLLMNEGKGDHVRFHALYRDSRGEIRVASCDQYSQLDKNAIADSFAELYNADVKRALEGAI